MILCTFGTKFNLMQCCLEKSLFNTILCDFLKGLIQGILAFLYIFKLDTLNTHCKSSFLGRRVITITGTVVRCNACFNNAFVERRIRPFEHQISEYLHAERYKWVVRELIAKVADTKLSLLIRLTHQIRHEPMLFVNRLL